MISNLIVLPWLGILVLAFIPSRNTDLIRKIGAGTAALCFVLSLQLWVLFVNNTKNREIPSIPKYTGNIHVFTSTN